MAHIVLCQSMELLKSSKKTCESVDMPFLKNIISALFCGRACRLVVVCGCCGCLKSECFIFMSVIVTKYIGWLPQSYSQDQRSVTLGSGDDAGKSIIHRCSTAGMLAITV